MKIYTDPDIGKFKLNDDGYFTQTVKAGRQRIRLVIDTYIDGSTESEKQFHSSLRVASRVHHELDQLVEKAKDIASTELLAETNETREEEDLKPISSKALRGKLKLLDVVCGAKEIFVNLSCSAFEDEHGLFVVSFGPKGGFRSVVCE